MRRFRVAALQQPGTELQLDREASHHLLVVCRHPRGQPVQLFAGGARQTATLTDVRDGAAILTITSAPAPVDAAPATHLIIGIPKGPALERALRMATELGVTEIHPALAKRSVLRGERRPRWERVVHSACQQCGRADIPTLHPVRTLPEALEQVPPDLPRFFGAPNAPTLPPVSGPAALAVGPEGGFDTAETTILARAGWRATCFGPHVLRSDTAVAAGLGALRSGGGRAPE
ncbi:MAG: 16S rRNA (uracil(1498)-N(3))-methyltransferase [Myxococcales bacterium]|nr:16S rRNA (uracil(1498)-N(3))-methyltransferase [Myxococcales bacterium]